MAESISIEETNAIREKLGLPPLAVQDESDEETIDPDKEAFDNYQQLKKDQERAKKEEETRKNIEKSKNRKRNLAKLQGKGLGEASDEEDDSALNWIKKSRKREKDLAARRARELDEMENTFQAYDSGNLAGLKVSHKMSEFDEGGETILTLKDRGILDEGDEDADELSNVNIEDREKLKKNLDLKKQKPGYNPYDDDQFNGGKQSILPQYEDEEEEGGFVIGNAGTIQRVKEPVDEKSVSQKLKEQTLSYEKMQEIKDYYTQEEADAVFKKPKTKKKKKNTRRKKQDEDDLNVSTTTTTTTQEEVTVPRQRTLDPDANFVDDDDLQEALARARRVANKQKNKLLKKMTPEEIAKQLKEEEEESKKIKMEEDDEGGLVLSEATEFVNSLGLNNVPTFNPRDVKKEKDIKVKPEPEYPVHVVEDEQPEEDIQMEEPQDQDTQMEEVKVKEEEEEEEKDVIVEEPLVSKGLAATLALLNQKGIIAKPTEDQIKRDKIAAEQIRWQNEQRKKERLRELEELREKERRRGNKGDKRGKDTERMRELEREREREREREEQKRLRDFEKAMQDYKPEVHLEYTDDSGRSLKAAEAFRFMSHKFHGMSSGKTKTEKRMKKIEEERRLNMMSSTDTPHNLASALLERQQRTGNAHVVLSVGNRGVVPTSTALGSPSSSKSNKK